MVLLNPTAPNELPAEALFARVRCRRAALHEGSIDLDERALAPDRQLQAVFDWTFLRLDRRLRRQLSPYLEILVVRQLILLLRHCMVGDPPPQVLQRSKLLNPKVVSLVLAEREPAQMVVALETALVANYLFISGLGRTYLQQGPGGVELQLGNGILQHSLKQAQPGVVQELVRYLIDLRNLLTVFKLWRWKVRRAPALVPGGQLARATLLRVWQNHDRNYLLNLAGHISGRQIAQEEAHQVERELLNGLSRRLKRLGREPLSVAVVLDYLWSCQLVAHNQALQQVVGAERQELLAKALLS